MVMGKTVVVNLGKRLSTHWYASQVYKMKIKLRNVAVKARTEWMQARNATNVCLVMKRKNEHTPEQNSSIKGSTNRPAQLTHDDAVSYVMKVAG